MESKEQGKQAGKPIDLSKFRIKSGVEGTHFGLTGDKIKELRKLGMTYNQIQKVIGCSKGTISYHLKGDRNGK